MRLSLYEKLALDRETAHEAALAAERRDRELARVKHGLAGLQLDLAFLKVWRALRRNYRPDQPRVPAGNGRESGRFTDDSGGSDSGRVRLAQGDRLQGFPIDLRDEDARGGHTIEGHVGKSHEYLLNEVRERQAAATRNRDFAQGLTVGSFTSLDSATRLVNSTLARNPGTVAEVVSGTARWATIDQQFGSPTGFEAYAATERSQPYIRETNGISVHIRPDRQSARGFRVHSAFPVSIDR